MESMTDHFQFLIERLMLAVQKKDWEQIAELDKSTKELLLQAQGQLDSPRVQELMAELNVVYQKLIADCRKEKGNIQKEMIDSLERHEKIREYQNRL